MLSSRTVSIYTGFCQRARSKEECETFAFKQGLNDITATLMNKVERPKGCYYHNDDDDNDEDEKLWFNTAVTENTAPCTDIRICVCKNGIQTSPMPASGACEEDRMEACPMHEAFQHERHKFFSWSHRDKEIVKLLTFILDTFRSFYVRSKVNHFC